ncbi:hypothetical protein RCL_jg15032.t1 [Rhizophagus clarus]|uniref:Uncharacterized protein n=1 Tax=Rhizophagus clarus TaxID=94130 RepID=A0A8H3M7L5_9GLOM|nr:hypothetical protein RCL_jg15032.t1 [Rhizophagus clarus]
MDLIEVIYNNSQNSEEESVTSDNSELLFITNVNADDYKEYSALFTGISNNPNNVYQKFLSKEFAEFMHIIINFHIQDPLANAFIQFFNKYLNQNNKLLPSTAQIG